MIETCKYCCDSLDTYEVSLKKENVCVRSKETGYILQDGSKRVSRFRLAY